MGNGTREIRGFLAGTILAVAACSNPVDTSENAFPRSVLGPLSAEGDAGGDGDAATAVAETESFLVDCIKIETLGSVGPEAFQARFLGIAWTADITAYKLNILFEATDVDGPNGKATFMLRSGVGSSPADMCAEPTTDSPAVVGTWEPGVGDLRPNPDLEAKEEGFCVEDLDPPDASGAFLGRTEFAMSADEFVWVYAEDDDLTPFNCTADERPDAVPLRRAQVTITLSADGLTAAGRLHACLAYAEAETLCSCIGKCEGEGPDDLQTEGVCKGCPLGGVPLAEQLNGVTTSEPCTGHLGEPAFDLVASFSAKRLPKTPEVCPPR